MNTTPQCLQKASGWDRLLLPPHHLACKRIPSKIDLKGEVYVLSFHPNMKLRVPFVTIVRQDLGTFRKAAKFVPQQDLLTASQRMKSLRTSDQVDLTD